MRLVPLSALAPRYPPLVGPDGEGALRAAAMFADISGFTALTDALSRHGRGGAEALADALRGCFNPIVRATHAHGGFITGFAGDAACAIFPGGAAQARAAAEAALAAFRAQPTRDTPYGAFPFGIRIGLSGGEVRWCRIDVTPERALLLFEGEAIDRCAAAQERAPEGGLAATPFDPLPAPAAALDALATHPFAPVGAAAFPLAGEFRHVASAFVAFSGAQALPARLRRAHAACARYGGTITNVFTGDKGPHLLALFGAPRAREDDPLRAARFATEIAAAGQVKVGLSFGLVYAGFNGGTERLEYTALGRSVNLSARLMAAAPWGEVWCAGRLRALLSGRAELSARGALKLKGFSEPVEAATVGGLRAQRRLVRPLIGRRAPPAGARRSRRARGASRRGWCGWRASRARASPTWWRGCAPRWRAQGRRGGSPRPATRFCAAA